MTTLHLREGFTGSVPWQLFGNKVPVNLTGVNKVALVLVPLNGTGTAATIDTTADPAKITISTAATGRVTWTPASGDVTNANSPYKAFFWVYQTASAKFAVPDDEDIVIEVTNDYV